jgi:hypothetical protein
MPDIDDPFERGTEAVRAAMRTALTAWGGSEACIDAYEAGVRAATEAQMTLADVIQLEPARLIATHCADLTRDFGATQVSSARWLLDV